MAGRVRGIALQPSERATLERLAKGRAISRGIAVRCKVILYLATPLSVRAAAKEAKVSRHTVTLWRDRFLAEGVDGLKRERPRSGRPRKRTT